MRPIWNHQTSVTRDFTILSIVIVCIAIFASLWVAYETFIEQSNAISHELEQEADRIDRAFNSEIERAAYLLEAMGRQIIQRGTSDKTVIAQMLRSFDSENDYYSLFLWVDDHQQAVTSSQKGVLDKPEDLSDRGYIKKSLTEPFKIHIGKPVFGRVSDKLVIPMGMGLTDYTGKYIGTVTLSLDLEAMKNVVQEYIRNESVNFSILSESLSPLAENTHDGAALTSEEIMAKINKIAMTPTSKGMVQIPDMLSHNRTFAYYQHSSKHPYIILTGYSSTWNALKKMMMPRLLQLLFVAAFMVSLLWLVRFRIIYPVQALAEASMEVVRGNTSIILPKTGPLEISLLAQHLQNVVDYIAERKRIEEELVAKVLALKTAKDIAEVSDFAKMEILNSLRQEIFPAMEEILNAASVLQDQAYGKIEGLEYKNYIQQLDKSSTHVTSVLHEIFEFPKLELLEPLHSRKPIDVNAIVHKCVGLLSAMSAREEVTVSIRIPDDMPKLAMNELHLMHVIMHLLVACLRSIPAGGELSVEAALDEHEDHTEFAILFKDNGTGLDTQHIARLWRATEQSRRLYTHATTEEERDAGYHAITLTKKIITLHNGRMTMQNPPGKEAVIAVYFPQ